MAAIIRQKLRAATIVETMVAMTILLVMFGMAITVLVQVTMAGNSEKKIKAEQLLNEFAIKTREEKQYDDLEITEDGFLLKRTVQPRGSDTGLLEIDYSIYDDGKKRLSGRKELVIHDETN